MHTRTLYGVYLILFYPQTTGHVDLEFRSGRDAIRDEPNLVEGTHRSDMIEDGYNLHFSGFSRLR